MFGLVGWYDVRVLDLDTRVILPYSQALCKFANHIQQLDMESNGKKVNKYTNKITTYDCGPKVFGDPGTNGQHSFYQLILQGRRCYCEFIGCCRPQYDCHFNGEKVLPILNDKIKYDIDDETKIYIDKKNKKKKRKKINKDNKKRKKKEKK